MAGQQTYNMGQIIYILSNKSQAVVPAIVDEQVVRKIRKADGIHEVVSYKLCIGPKDRQQVVDLAKIDGEVFDSLESIRDVLVERLTGFVDDLVKTTQKNVLNWYGIATDNQLVETIRGDQTPEGKFDPAQLVHAVNNNIPIHGGSVTAHSLQLQQPMPTQQQGINPHMSVRDNIRAMVEEPEDGMQGLAIGNPGDNTPKTVILEDGTRVQVKL
jgi:hypothetical protein